MFVQETELSDYFAKLCWGYVIVITYFTKNCIIPKICTHSAVACRKKTIMLSQAPEMVIFD